ncbi:Uncharacterised protein [Bordetella avium]|nr:Uncharacterised protein [Bordetella avium]
MTATQRNQASARAARSTQRGGEAREARRAVAHPVSEPVFNPARVARPLCPLQVIDSSPAYTPVSDRTNDTVYTPLN